MNQLEQTIIERARGYLAGVIYFYAKGEQADELDRHDFQSNHASLTALLEFGHLADSGMSADAQAQLLAIEAEAAAAIPGRTSVQIWPQGGAGKSSGIQALLSDCDEAGKPQ